MAKSPVPPEFDVALVTVPSGKMTAVWWEWLQRYVKWDEACCEAGSGGGSSGVSDITGTPPVVVTGTALFASPEALSSGAVTISMPPATGSVNGYLKATDWTTFNGKAAASHSHPESDVTGLVSDLALKAPLASPVFTGDPQAPTAALGDSDTSIATTAFVSAAVSNTFTGGMSTAEYTYSTTTTTPPSTGQLRANTTTQTAITAFYLHETNAVGVDITNALKLITTGVKVLCQDKTNAANVQYYVVSGPAVDNGVYFTIPVTWTTGGSNFTAGRVIFAGFGIGSNNMPEAPTDGQIYGRRGSDASWQVAGGGVPLTDGDKGDVVVSASGATWLFDTSVVTTAAKTVLDDTTTGAMLTTLGAEPAIAAGTTSQYWRGDKSWQTLPAGSVPGGSTTQVQFNDGGAFGGDAGLVYNKTTDTLTIAGSLTAGGTVTANQNFNSSTISAIFSTSAAGTVYLRPNGQGSTTGQVTVDNAGAMLAAGISLNASGIWPNSVDNGLYCGKTGNRWYQVWAGLGTVQTSDANEKRDIRSLSPREKVAAQTMKDLIVAYRWQPEAIPLHDRGAAEKINIGVIAQQIAQALLDAGLDPNAYSMWRRDAVMRRVPPVLDGRGNVIEAGRDEPTGEYHYSVDYNQVLAFIIGGM